MALDDFAESEVAAAVALAAMLFSPRVRGLVRSGVVSGLARLLSAGDILSAAAHAVGRSTEQGAARGGFGFEDITASPEAPEPEDATG